jgi:2'-5' RNA ligase
LRSAPFRVQAFALFSSQLTPQGAIYTRLAEFPLQG